MNKVFCLFLIQQALLYLQVFKVQNAHFLLKQNTGLSILVKQDSHLLAGLPSLRSFCRQPLSVPCQSQQPTLLHRLLKGLTGLYHIMPILPPLQVSTSLTSFCIPCGRRALLIC